MYEYHQGMMDPSVFGHYGFAQGVGAPGWLLALVAFAAPLIVIVILWSIFWKGLALWHSARRGQYWWFIILLFVNTGGILEIIYLFFLAKLKFSQLFTTDSHTHNAHH
jgi:methionyl-tRNA synthetase